MIKKPVIYAFIDSQNLNLGVRSQGWILDFVKFRTYLKEKYRVLEAFLFIGFIPYNNELYISLQKAGYTLIFKPVLEYRRFKKTKIKGNVDAELVLHAMIQYRHYDKAVIISGDGDFYCLIEYLVNNNELFKIIVPNKKYSSLLRKYGDYIVNMNLIRDKVKLIS